MTSNSNWSLRLHTTQPLSLPPPILLDSISHSINDSLSSAPSSILLYASYLDIKTYLKGFFYMFETKIITWFHIPLYYIPLYPHHVMLHVYSPLFLINLPTPYKISVLSTLLKVLLKSSMISKILKAKDILQSLSYLTSLTHLILTFPSFSKLSFPLDLRLLFIPPTSVTFLYLFSITSMDSSYSFLIF